MRTLHRKILCLAALAALCLTLTSASRADSDMNSADRLAAVASDTFQAGKIGSDCTFKDKKLWGKVKVVTSFPDFKVKKVSAFADLHVKMVDAFPDKCGMWQLVDSFPDFTVQYVDSFPDFEIKLVDAFPGVP